MKSFLSSVAAIVLCLGVTTTQATTYIPAQKLSDSIDVQRVQGPVQQGNTMNMPIITWGEDMRTILANGNHTTTTTGSMWPGNAQFNLIRQDDFLQQVQSYLRGETPYLRGTLTMVNLVNDLTKSHPDLQPVVIAQLSWSQGGDTLVVKDGITRLSDLKGKTIVLQANGPHIHLLNRALRDANLSINDVNVRWVQSLTNAEHTPLNAFYNDDVHAAFMITPDALAVTACATNCGVGDGSDDSIRGARILYSTRSANRIVSDVYAVRADYLKSNSIDVQNFVHTLYKAKESVDQLVKNTSSPEYRRWLESSARALLDDAGLSEDAEALFNDAYHASFADNVKFFTDSTYMRNFDNMNKEIQQGLLSLNLITGTSSVAWAQWDFNQLRSGVNNAANVAVPQTQRREQVSNIIEQRRRQGTLADSQFLSFPIFFQPNQNTFSESQYSADFDRFLDYASTYGGAVITLEGHCDPQGYLKAKLSDNQPVAILNRIRQSCMNLSISRATGVRDAIVEYAATKGITLNPAQFETIGHGMDQPATGLCGSDPCKINSRQEWLSNMRVVVGVTVVEAEISDFESF